MSYKIRQELERSARAARATDMPFAELKKILKATKDMPSAEVEKFFEATKDMPSAELKKLFEVIISAQQKKFFEAYNAGLDQRQWTTRHSAS